MDWTITKGSTVALKKIFQNSLACLSLFSILVVSCSDIPVVAAGDREGWKHFRDEGNRHEAFHDYLMAEKSYAKSLQLATSSVATPLDRAELVALLATVMIWQQKHEEAEPYFKQLLEVIPKFKGKDARNEDFLSCIDSLCNAYFEKSFAEKRISGIQHSIRLIDTAFGDTHPSLPKELIVLSYTYSALGMHKEALTFANRALAITKRNKTEKGVVMYSKALAQLGHCRKAVGDWVGAQKAFEESISYLGTTNKSVSITTAASKAQLALVYYRLGRKADSKRLMREAEILYAPRIAELDTKRKWDVSSSGAELVPLAQLYMVYTDFEKAEPILARSILWTEKIYGKKDPNLINELNLHSFVLSRLRRQKESAQQLERAESLKREFKVTN